jgi:uncharacterized protein YjbI with pentapeptide repeats
VVGLPRYLTMAALTASHPMPAEEFAAALALHHDFIASGGAGGHWDIIVTTPDLETGIVLGIYTSPTATSGEQADFGHQRLDGLDLRGLVLPYADLTACSARGQDLAHADLSGCLAIDSDFSGASFRAARLVAVDFSRAELAGCDFSAADLTNADFENADLTGADLRGARLEGARVPGALLTGARM